MMLRGWMRAAPESPLVARWVGCVELNPETVDATLGVLLVPGRHGADLAAAHNLVDSARGAPGTRGS